VELGWCYSGAELRAEMASRVAHWSRYVRHIGTQSTQRSDSWGGAGVIVDRGGYYVTYGSLVSAYTQSLNLPSTAANARFLFAIEDWCLHRTFGIAHFSWTGAKLSWTGAELERGFVIDDVLCSLLISVLIAYTQSLNGSSTAANA
jgi:hypothetical protein